MGGGLLSTPPSLMNVAHPPSVGPWPRGAPRYAPYPSPGKVCGDLNFTNLPLIHITQKTSSMENLVQQNSRKMFAKLGQHFFAISHPAFLQASSCEKYLCLPSTNISCAPTFFPRTSHRITEPSPNEAFWKLNEGGKLFKTLAKLTQVSPFRTQNFLEI